METPRPNSNLSNTDEQNHELGDEHSEQPNDEHQNDENHDSAEENNQHDEEQQNEMYMKTLKQASFEKNVEKSPKISPLGSRNNLNRNSKRPVSARSANFKSSSPNRRSKSLASSANDPYLRSLNDLKYVGDQFVAGKLDPTLKPAHEIRFQRLHSLRLKKLRADTSNEKNLFQTLSEFKQTKNPKIIDKATERFLTNDLKYTGNQFKVGKIDPKLQSSCEQRFQKIFGNKLKVLLPDQSKTPRPFSYEELKKMHTMHALPKNQK